MSRPRGTRTIWPDYEREADCDLSFVTQLAKTIYRLDIRPALGQYYPRQPVANLEYHVKPTGRADPYNHILWLDLCLPQLRLRCKCKATKHKPGLCHPLPEELAWASESERERRVCQRQPSQQTFVL